MTIYQDKDAGLSGLGAGVLVAPVPVLPDGRGTNNNLIPIGAIPAGRDLTLEISTTTWTPPDNDDTVSVQVTRTAPPTVPQDSDFVTLPRVSLGPVLGRPATFSVTVPAEYLGEDPSPAGPTSVWVRIALFHRNFNQLSSAVVEFLIDRTAPWQAKPLQTGPVPGVTPGAKSVPLVTFPNAPAVSDLIDETWEAIAGNENGLKCLINTTYPNFQATDRLTLYAAGVRTDPPQVAPIFDAQLPVSHEVAIPLNVLKAVTTGRVQIWFRLTDLSDNFSQWKVEYRNVRFLPLPVLAPPIVPLAQTDNLIDLGDVRTGVTVRVTRPLNTLDTDVVSLTWGAQTAQDLPFGSAPELTFTVPWAKLQPEYFDNQTGTDYVLPVEVRANLMRGGSSVSTNATVVDTDYSVVGAPYPDDPTNPPEDENVELKPLIVRGKAPVTDNVLGPQDANETATIFIDLTPDSGGVWPDPESGDVVTVYYRGDSGQIVVGSELLTTTNVNTVIEMDLPYSIVGPGGLGLKDVWWELENPNRNNTQKAPTTKVTVNTVVITLEKPELVRPAGDTGINNQIICTSLTLPTRFARFHIPKNDHLVQGVAVTFNWRGFHQPDFTVPAPADTEFTATRTVTADEELNGMLFDVGPYDPFIRNLPRPPATPPGTEFYAGYVKVWYSTPVVPTSVEAEMLLYLLNADFKYCESEPGWMPTVP